MPTARVPAPRPRSKRMTSAPRRLAIFLAAAAALPLAAACVPAARAAVWRVPDPWPSLQAALDAALPGDTVLVAPGVYYGNFLWPDRAGIDLLSEDGAEVTILDGLQTETVLGLYSAAIDTTTIVRGFTITHGKVGGT